MEEMETRGGQVGNGEFPTQRFVASFVLHESRREGSLFTVDFFTKSNEKELGVAEEIYG